MAGNGMLRLVLVFSVLSSLLFTSSDQTCKSQSLSSKQQYVTCVDLPFLSSFLHWSYDQSTGKLDVAYVHTGVTSPNRWVAWALNPSNNLNSAMTGAQALVAIIQSNGTPRVYTSPIAGPGTSLAERDLSFPVPSKSVTYQNDEVTIYATLTLSFGVTSIVHLWQDGQVSGSTPQSHAMDSANILARQTLNLNQTQGASSTQTCKSQSLSSNQQFATCLDLPHLSSFLHWSYDQSTGKLDVAYVHTGVTSGRWVAWALNPSNNMNNAMNGAQALVAIVQSNGTPRVYTSPIADRGTSLAERDLSFPVPSKSVTYQNGEVTIYATLTLSFGVTSIVHLWQDGQVSGSTPQVHAMDSANFFAKQTLNLVSGQTQGASNANSLRRRNIHGILNAVSWGILMPIGAIIARYLKVFKSADPAWFYLHVTCQVSAYAIGVAGWGTGLKLGSDSVGVTYKTHRALGIVLFCLGTLQAFALLLRPKKDHKFRFYWNVYHHLVGYTTIIISIVNIFEGFDALEEYTQNHYDHWKQACIGIIAALGGIAVLLEVYTWIIVLKRRKTEAKMSNGVNGTNGVNGYGSRPQQV